MIDVREIFNIERVVELVEEAKTELEVNMLDYEGKVVVMDLISSGAGSRAGREFLELCKLKMAFKEIDEENEYVEEAMREVAESLMEVLEEDNAEIEGHSLEIGFNEADGAIDLFLVFDNYDEIESMDKTEYAIMRGLKDEYSCELCDIEFDSKETWTVNGDKYMVLFEDEADERARDYIEDALWTFNSSFLSGETDVDEMVFDCLREKRCESCNDAIRSIIDATCGMDDFVDSAISADGRGSYLNYCDGSEDEINVDGDICFIYKQD